MSEISTVLVWILVGSIPAILLWGFKPRIARLIRKKPDQDVATSFPSQETVAQEKKTRFWTTMVIAAVSGSLLFIGGLAMPMSADLTLGIARGIMIGLGLCILLIFAIFTTYELHDTWKFRKEHETACLRIFRDFDEAYNVVQEVSAPELKRDMLRHLQSKLNILCNSCSWEEAKDRVGKVLEFMPERLSNESPLYLQFLTMIIQTYDENVVGIISKKWLKEMKNLYDDTQSSFSLIDVLYILQELHGYDYSFMEKLIDDATLSWSRLRFDMLADHIGFAKLKKTNPEAHKLILKYLLRKLDDAAKGNEDEIKKRLRFLYNKAVM